MKCFCSYVTENFSSIYKIVRDAKLLQLHLDLMTQKYCRVFVVAVIIIYCDFYLAYNHQIRSIQQIIQNDLLAVVKTVKENAYRKVSILDRCDHIYYDVGSNIGI